MKEDILAVPLFVYCESPAILTGIIMLHRREWRIVLIMTVPGISDILVKRIAIAVELPQSRYRNVIPLSIVKRCGIELFRTRIDALVPAELPGSVQGHLKSVGLEMRRHRHAVFFYDSRILPVRQGVLSVKKKHT